MIREGQPLGWLCVIFSSYEKEVAEHEAYTLGLSMSYDALLQAMSGKT